MNKRLEAIKNLVQKGSVVADIGTDHAYVPIALLKEGISSLCYACDVIEGPCTIARAHVEQEGLSKQIHVIKSNGFENVPLDIDVAIIAGMGFGTARIILEKGFEHIHRCKQIIVQVNKDVVDLRRWISDHHFTITAEAIVYDDHFYQIVVFNTTNHPVYSDVEILVGPLLLKQRSDCFIEHCKECLQTYNRIGSVLPKENKRHMDTLKKIQMYESILDK